MKQLILPLLFLALALRGQAQSKSDPFNLDRILKIEIQMAPADWKYVRTSHRTAGDEAGYESRKAEVTIDGVEIGAVAVRKKGFLGSVVSTRPSLKVDLDKYVKGRQFEGLSGMTLNNNNQDASLVQTVIAYEHFRKAGAPASRAAFAHVIVNGEDLGIYTNVEPVNRAMMQRLFGNSDGLLLEGSGTDLTGQGSGNGRLEEKSGAAKNVNRDRIKELAALLEAAGPVQLSKIAEYVEMDSFLTLWVAEVLIGHFDGYSGNRNNYFVYENSKTRKLTFFPWGPDSVFRDPGPLASGPLPKSVKAAGILCRRLWELPEIRTRYQAEMKRQLSGVWDEKAMIGRIAQLQQPLEKLSTTNRQAAQIKTTEIEAFIKTRRDEINKELDAAEPPVWPVSASQPSQPPPRMEIKGTFDAPYLAAAPEGSPFGTGSGTLSVTGAKRDPVFERYAAFVTVGSGLGMERIRQGYPSIKLVGMEQSSKELWVATFLLDPHRLNEQTTSLPLDNYEAWAVIIQGANRRLFDVRGELKFTTVSVKPGGRIAGSFTLTTGAF